MTALFTRIDDSFKPIHSVLGAIGLTAGVVLTLLPFYSTNQHIRPVLLPGIALFIFGTLHLASAIDGGRTNTSPIRWLTTALVALCVIQAVSMMLSQTY